MPDGGQNIVELGFNVEELSAQKKQVLDLFVDMFGQLEKYDGTKFNPLGNGGLADLKKSISDGSAAMQEYAKSAQQYNDIITQQAQKQQQSKAATSELSQAMQAYQRITDQTAQAAAKNNAATSEAASGLAAEREALRQRNTELANAAKLQLSVSGSINEATIKVDQLKAARNSLDLTTDEGTKKQAAFNEQINQLNAFIKENVSVLEQTKINIGNYSGSLSTAFDAQREQLELINKQLAEMEVRGKNAFQNLTPDQGQPLGFFPDRNKGNNNVSGQTGAAATNLAGGASQNVAILNQDSAAYQKLTLQQKILEQSLDRQTVGFKTANQELRSVKNTLDALTLAGAENTETFEKISVAYTTAEQKVKDLHREQAILTTDAPGLTALTGVARGLGGAYALGAGAAQLFATGNEKLDKELNKLVAVMTFLQGLEAAVGALKTKNAIATALEEEATKALNFVKAVEVSWFGKSKAVIEAESAAKLLNTTATEGAEGATVANAEAMGAMAVATEGAEVATIGLTTAIAATGIGAIIVGVAILVAKIIEWSEAENKAAQNSADLAEAMEKVNEILMARIKLSDEDAEHTKKNLENALDLADKNKESYNDIYAVKKAQADLDQKTAENDLKHAAGTNDIGAAYRSVDGEIKSLTAGMDPLLTKQQQLVDIQGIWLQYQQNKINQSEAYFQIWQKYNTNTDAEDAKTQLDFIQKQIDANQKLIDSKKKLTGNYDQSQITQSGLSIEQIQHASDEERKIALSTATTEADYVKSKNAIILADDRSTLAQRLAAIQSNAEQEKKITQANLAYTLSDPQNKDSHGNYDAEATTAISKAAEDRKKIANSAQADTYKTIVEWNDKRLTLINEINNDELQQDVALQNAISANIQKDLGERLEALKSSIDDKTKIIQDDYNLQMTLAKEHNKTQAEFDKIESDRKNALVALTADTQKKIYDITISYGEARLKKIEELNKTTPEGNATAEGYNKQSEALNKSFLSGSIGYNKFNEEKKKADDKYRIDKDNADIRDDEVHLQRIKDGQDKEQSLKLAAANADLTNAKAGGSDSDIANAQAKVDALNKIQDGYDADTNAASKKLDDDTTKRDNDAVKRKAAAGKFLAEQENELGKKTFDFASQLVDASYEKKIRNIELETEREDAASEATIAAVQRSTLGQRQQAEEVTILQQQQRERDSAAKKEVRQEKVSEARFDRDVAVAKAIWAGAYAEIEALGEYAGTPYAFGIAAVIAATTAVEVASILAKPIPTYAEGVGIPGKGHHPGGVALVGEDGTERVSMPGHKPFLVNQPTLLDMPAMSIVEPLNLLNRDLVSELGGISMQRAYAMMSTPLQDHSVERAINNQTSRLERALKRNQRQTVRVVNNINITEDASTHYKIYGKRK